MSQIDEIIQEFCPDGVEFKKLGDIAQLVRGNGMPKSDLVLAEGVGAIHYGQIYTRYGVWANTTISFVTPTTAIKLAKVEPGDLIVTNTSENVEDVGKAVAWLGEQSIVTGGHATVIKHNQDPKFLSYWFRSESFFTQKKALASGTKVIDVSAKQLADVHIPIPPLQVQREIVGVLDTLADLKTELTRALEAEIEGRQRRYKYYRDSLVGFEGDESISRVPMGQIGEFIRGRRFTKNDFVDLGIPSIHYGEIYTYYGTATDSTISHVRKDLAPQLRYAQPGDVVIAAVGETVEDVGKAVAWLGDEKVAIHDDCFLYRSHLNPKFVSYYLQSGPFNAQKGKHVSRAKVKRLSSDGLAKILIPVPSEAEQERVVALLDKVTELVDELLEVLPAEITARREQFDHYLNKLLTFKELAA
ncbi:type I restriction enzyme, S subunit [Raineyella antarctica]|uniref:Type I restriction enzyme, S subunit n=1 Tax=Raineyella antarctica TaxID=1577474 RepID=A0A1G6GZS6_9ACTN|nr:restriction endonuclease subunit S [Raineyella antarctica]SDB87185.1 type I restriction enzyme, S subunit [Raineyella antarctica]